MAKRSTTTGKSRKATTTKTAKPKPKAAKVAPKPKAPPKPPAKPKHSDASLARRKATLISGLKSPSCTNEAEIRAELEREPMASTPILSYDELRRLEG